MKNAILLAILFLSMSIVGQKNKSTIIETSKKECTKKVSNNLKIYCNGGQISILTKDDLVFQKKYSVVIIDLGCLHSSGKELENYKKINSKTFESLKSTYGLKWVSELKQNAIGFNEWKSKSS